MKTLRIAAATACAATLAWNAWAGVSANEAAQLGKTLTPMGAIKAGNADGSIPAYTGGMTKPPAGWTKDGAWIDPYKDEKAILKIDATNMDKHADKLSDGVITLIKTKPGFYINVFKTHRDYAFPKHVEEGTAKNAGNTECKTFNEGLSLDKACRGGYPFPIPKTGKEVMWNKLTNYVPPVRSSGANWLVDSSGTPIMTSSTDTYRDNFNYFGGPLPRSNTDAITIVNAVVTGPNRLAGSAQGQKYNLDPVGNPNGAWSYSPGQRRVRMAPEFNYDTPHSGMGGAMLYDEIYLFSGMMDRFDFKLLGKKEAFIPANNYGLTLASNPACMNDKSLQKTFINPECVRFELRRVWEVEATLLPGKRHIYAKRKWLIDEDSYTVGTYEAWDQSGKIYRVGLGWAAQSYDPDHTGPFSPGYALYDLQKNHYLFVTAMTKKPVFGNPMKESDTQPEAVATRSAR